MEELWRDNNIFFNALCFVVTENEKFFDRSDAVLYWKTVFHTFAILHHGYIAVFAISLELMKHTDPDIQMLYIYRTAYLTGWNFVFQTLFLGMSLGHDMLEWVDKQNSVLGSRLRYWRDIIFTSMVVPFTLFVTTMFWSVYAVDRELVFPRVYDEVVPWWFNHCVHTNITVMVAVETLLQARRHPTDKRIENGIYFVIALAYAVVYYTIYYFTRRWLYQVFGIMNWWQIVIYQIVIWLFIYGAYLLQFPINRLIHGSEDPNEANATKEVSNLKNGEDNNGTVLKNGSNGVGKLSNGAAEKNAVNGVGERVVANGGIEMNGANGVEEKNANGVDRIVNGVGGNNGVGNNGVSNNGVKDKDISRDGIDGKVITDLKTPPFSTKSWSLKYRSLRNQFENSHL